MTEEIIEGFRLSPQQRHLWLLQAADESLGYRSQCGVVIEGDLKTHVVRKAVEQIIVQHKILRTVFPCLPEMNIPVQLVNERGLSWRTIDLVSVGTTDQEIRLEELFEEEGRVGFDFAKGPTFRATLVGLKPDKHLLILTLPALCADAWTLNNLVSEISRAYAATLESNPLVEEPFEYVQFSEWQNELLESNDEDAELGREFWRSQTNSQSKLLKLPFERESAKHGVFTPQSLELTIDPSVRAKIDAIALQHHTSSSIFLLASWQTLLWRLTGSDVVVSNLCDGRQYEELRNTLGLFAKAVPVSCDFSANLRFSELLERISQLTRDAYDWQSYFNWDESVGADADPGSFPIAFEFVEWAPKDSVYGVSFSIYKPSSCIDRFKLKLSCQQTGDALVAQFHYDDNVFERETVERIARYFETLVASASQNPEARVSELELIGEAEQRQLLFEFNETQSPFPDDQCIHELFEKQAAESPDAAAVRFNGQQLSYGELNARANRLAHLLSERTASTNAMIGLCVERSLEMIVGLLGILKSGCAYVPLNPEHPKARLARQLSEIQARVVVTQRSMAHKLPDFEGEIICLDDEELFETQPTTNLRTKTVPESLAYVLYTSGSTGIPKGVAVQHRNLVNYTHFICEKLKLNELPERLQFASVTTINADLGNTCIFPSLVSGGCLHILSFEVATDGAKFARYLQKHPIDVLKIVPTHLSSLLETMGTEARLPRKYLIFGGDVLSWELAERITRIDADCEVINHYGPTETTVGSLTFDLKEKRSLSEKTSHVPIGRPISNTRIYILDRELKLAPIGVAGQLCIAGAGVAEGYLNQAEETAKRFINNPYNTNGGSRLYLTGDLARYLPDGNVEFLGRVDHQVKIRGYRVELGEIEAVLNQHPQVRQVVVVSRGEEDKILVGYVVPRRGSALSQSKLRTYLSEQLPDYMVPAILVFLKALPLTSNGKVDRAALPPPAQTDLEFKRTYLAPRTPVEEIVAGIWVKLLKQELIGIDDNFFELGGHSLMVTQVASRLRVAFGIELPLRTLFESPTISSLAAIIEKGMQNEEGFQPPALVRVSREEPLPLSFAQQRLWFLDQLEQGSSFYHISKAFRFRGKLNVAALSEAINEIVRRHEPLRTSFVSVEGMPLQRIGEPRPVPLPVFDLVSMPRADRDDEARRLANVRRREAFDLSRGPLLRATVIRVDQEEWVFALTIHHIAGDAWSLSILFRELTVLYSAFAQNRPSPLPELDVQFADYAAWQRSWFEGERLEKHVSYWKQQLTGAPLVLELPTDKPRPSEQTFRGARVRFDLGLELTANIKNLSKSESVTPFMTLLAAFQLLLSRHTGQTDLIVGADVANRTRVETEAMIGFFVNVLPLRVSFAGNPAFSDLLAQVRETTLRAYAHQEVPFERLVAELKPKRDLSRNPLVQALLVMQNTPAQELEIEGASVTPFELPAESSRFDLALFLWERGDRFFGSWLYNPDLFETRTIERMSGHFETLLQSILDDPSARVDSFRMKTGEELMQEEVEKKERHQLQVHSLRDTRRRGVEL